MYLRGIDLFNHGFYWESHEAWEAVWISAGRRGSVADFLKALIKVAAAASALAGESCSVTQQASADVTAHVIPLVIVLSTDDGAT